jgi:uncharacterized protein YjiS (DUF1127 family)
MLLTHILANIRRHLTHRKAMRDLSGLEDHLLADLGISRGEIAAVVQHGR